MMIFVLSVGKFRFCGSPNDTKSTSGYAFKMASGANHGKVKEDYNYLFHYA